MQTRVLMVLESVFPTPGGGGAESQVRTLGLHLPQRGVAVSVLVPMVGYGPQVQRDRVDGIEVWRIAYPKLRSVGAAVMLVKLAWRLFRLRGDYDFIHAHIAGNMAAVSCVMGRLLGKPVLIKLTGMTEMVGGILDPQAGWTGWVKRHLMRGADFYQATSSQIARMLVEAGFDAGKVHRIPNAVDTARFATLARNPDDRAAVCGQRRLVGVYVGRLEAEKDLELMLRGWAGAFQGRDDVALVLVGSGSRRPALEALAAELGIAGQVVFAGPTKTVERFLAIADIGLLTSRAEGLSNTLLEYMASGLPVIGSRVSGTEDFVIDGRTGWLFPAGDVAQLRVALQQAGKLGAEALRGLGENARQLVTADASNAAVIGRLLELYGHEGRAR
jgi:L-malate glycosyltransferase